MGYFPVRYDSRVVNYDRRGFIRLATGLPLFYVSRLGHNTFKISPNLVTLLVGRSG